MKFSGAMECTPRRSDQILGPIAQIIPKRVNNVKKWGLGGGLHSLSASNFLPLAALYYSDNLVEMEYR